MKKLTLLFAAGALLAFASCNNNENNTTKEQIDSIVTARVDATDAALRAKNDSMINAMAKMRADDSMAKVNSGAQKTGTVTARAGVKEVKHTTTTHTTTSQPKGTETDAVKPANSTITTEQKKQQDNKFNER